MVSIQHFGSGIVWEVNEPSNKAVVNNEDIAPLELALYGRELSANALFT